MDEGDHASISHHFPKLKVNDPKKPWVKSKGARNSEAIAPAKSEQVWDGVIASRLGGNSPFASKIKLWGGKTQVSSQKLKVKDPIEPMERNRTSNW